MSDSQIIVSKYDRALFRPPHKMFKTNKTTDYVKRQTIYISSKVGVDVNEEVYQYKIS